MPGSVYARRHNMFRTLRKDRWSRTDGAVDFIRPLELDYQSAVDVHKVPGVDAIAVVPSAKPVRSLFSKTPTPEEVRWDIARRKKRHDELDFQLALVREALSSRGAKASTEAGTTFETVHVRSNYDLPLKNVLVSLLGKNWRKNHDRKMTAFELSTGGGRDPHGRVLYLCYGNTARKRNRDAKALWRMLHEGGGVKPLEEPWKRIPVKPPVRRGKPGLAQPEGPAGYVRTKKGILTPGEIGIRPAKMPESPEGIIAFNTAMRRGPARQTSPARRMPAKRPK